MEKDPEAQLEKIVREDLNVFPAPSLRSVKWLIRLEKDGKRHIDIKKYLNHTSDFILYLMLHSEWKGLDSDRIESNEDVRARRFYSCLAEFASSNSNDRE